MNSVNNNLLSNDLYWKEEGVPISDGTENAQLTQEDFFALLTQQLSQQDPTKPVDNDQMVAQMTSFTMADSLSQLNQKFDEFASSMNSNQALQATSLIGQTVLVNNNTSGTWQEGAVSGGIVTNAPVDDMRIQIVDEYGSVVREIEAGPQEAGVIPFSWDGTDASGNHLPRGKYQIQASGIVEGLNTELEVHMNAQVSGTAIATRDVQDLTITIEDQAGQVIRTMNVGSAQAGNIDFGWDGTDNEGRIMPPGNYTISVEGKVNGQTEALQFGVNKRVNSVSLAGSGTEGVILNLAGDESIRLSDIINIGN